MLGLSLYLSVSLSCIHTEFYTILDFGLQLKTEHTDLQTIASDGKAIKLKFK